MIALALLAALSATPANFAVLARTSAPGDTLQLAPGYYGDQVVKYHALHITGPREAVFRSLRVMTSDTTLDGFSIAMVPTPTTPGSQPALQIAGTSTWPARHVTASNLKIACGPALSGLDPTQLLPAKWGGGNVIGWPSGVGVTFGWGDHLTVQNSEITACEKGVVLGGSYITIQGNNIHDVRTSPITGGPGSYTTIANNRLANSRPFNPNHDGNGDHADFLHVLTVPGGAPVDHLTIKGNLIDQGTGVAILGIYLDDNSHNLGFPSLDVESNTIILGNTQGMRIEYGSGVVANNRLAQPPPNGPGENPPQIIVCDPAKPTSYCAPSHLTLSGNVTVPGIASPDVLAQMRANAPQPVAP